MCVCAPSVKQESIMRIKTVVKGLPNSSKQLLIIPLLVVLVQQQLAHAATPEDVAAAAALPTITASPSPTSDTPSLTNRQPAPPRIRLNKCCHLGEYLNATTRACIAGSSEHWVPRVYLIKQERFFNPIGSSPRFIQFAPNALPTMPAASAQGSCQQSDLELFNGRQDNLLLFSNGSLYVRERTLLIEPRSYCVDREVALVCFTPTPTAAEQQQQEQSAYNGTASTTPAAPTLRILKCCGKFGTYDEANKSCKVEMQVDGQLRLSPKLPEGSYQTLYGLPECAGGTKNASYVIAGDWSEAQLNHTSGDLQLTHKNLTAMQYCLEHTQRNAVINIIACSHHFAHRHPYADAPYFDDDIDDNGRTSGERLHKAVLNVGILISVVFLAATLVAGYMLPAVHHALHWRCQIYYVFCLLIGETLLSIEQLHVALVPGSAWCLLLALGMQFFFLSAFFWLNTMCFNIWWTFRDFRPSSLERNQEALRLRLYSVYAWGVPLLICTIAACVDQLPETTLLKPGFGQPYCWFKKRTLSIFAYFYGPIGLLLCANIVLFVSTTHQLTCGLWKRDDFKSTTEKSALGKVCLKLVVVMGVTWIADIISWVVGGPDANWLVTDLINALQGVFIFIVVGCQPQVWTACKRICCPRRRHDITNTTNGVQHSSSSQGLPSMVGGTEFTQNTSMNNTILQCGSPSVDAAGGVNEPSNAGDNSHRANGSGDSSTALTDAVKTSITPAAATATAKTAAAATATAKTAAAATPTTAAATKIPMETVC